MNKYVIKQLASSVFASCITALRCPLRGHSAQVALLVECMELGRSYCHGNSITECHVPAVSLASPIVLSDEGVWHHHCTVPVAVVDCNSSLTEEHFGWGGGVGSRTGGEGWPVASCHLLGDTASRIAAAAAAAAV